VVLMEHLQLNLKGKFGADLQMICALHPSRRSLSFHVLHVAGN
jgi:hypothetical protein